MMNERNRSTIKTVTISILIVLIIAVVGISFAYFTINYEIGDTYNVGGKAKSGEPQIEFNENKSGISLHQTYPMPNEVGIEKSDVYSYTVTSKENASNVKVNVYIQIDEESTLSDDLVNILYNDSIITIGTLLQGEPVDYGFSKAYKLDSFILEPNGVKTNNIKIWVNESATVDNALSKGWGSKIFVMPEFTDEPALSE